MDLRLHGRQALITGASKGIGLACAQVLAQEGCHLVLVSRDAARLEAAAARLTPHGDGHVVTHAADLANDEAREALAATYPDIDILVNNAGAAPSGSIATMPLETWRQGWELKVFGYVHLTKLYLDRMVARRSGCIVNVIGTAGRAPRDDYACGASGNAGLIAFTEAVGGRSPDDGVRVLGINPGYTATERFLGRPVDIDDLDPDQLRSEFPPNMRIALPSAIADVVAFLASDRARGMSGVVVDCDHGQLRFGPTKPLVP